MLTLAATLASLELGLRAQRRFREWRALRTLPPVEERVLVPSDDPELIYQFRAGVERDGFTTNSFGMANAETPERKPAGTFRIAFVGDSVSASWGYVARDEIYLNRIAGALNRRGGGLRIESLNFGVDGYSMLQSLHVARTRVPRFEPDFLVVQLSLNDPYTSETLYGRFAPDDPWRLRTLAFRTLLPDRHGGWFGVERNYDETGWASIRRGMEGYAQLAAQGVPLLLVLFPYLYDRAYQEWGYGALHARYAEEARRAGVDLFDLYPAFAAAGLVARQQDLHPDARGHDLAARALLAELERRGLGRALAAAATPVTPSGITSDRPKIGDLEQGVVALPMAR